MWRWIFLGCLFFLCLEAQSSSEAEEQLQKLLVEYGLVSADSNPNYTRFKKWIDFFSQKKSSPEKSDPSAIHQKLLEIDPNQLSRGAREDWFFFLHAYILPELEKKKYDPLIWTKPLQDLLDKPRTETLEGKFYVFATLKTWNETQEIPVYFESKDAKFFEILLKNLKTLSEQALQGIERWDPVLRPIVQQTQQTLKQAILRTESAYQNYRAKLKYEKFVDQTPEELLAFGEKAFADTWKEMQHFASTIDASISLEEHLKKIDEVAPSVDQLVETCQDLTLKALKFIQEKDLVSIPEKALNLQVKGVPPSGNMPYGFYQPFHAYCVPIPNQEKLSPVALKEFLRDFNVYRLTVIALHEAYPGHHLQYCKEVKSTRALFQDYFTSFYVEGWGLYCEEMMYRHGYYQHPYTRLAQLKMKLWRCARVILDIKMHVFGMSVQDASTFLKEKALLSSEGALQEATRYFYNPLQPMSYLVGSHDIHAIRNEVRQLLGAQYSEKEFHDEFLIYGPIPLKLARLHLLHWAHQKKAP